MSKKMSQQFACSKMMLPEHRDNLLQHRRTEERTERCRQPAVDEQALAEQQQIFEEALHSRRSLRITIVTEEGCLTYTGLVRRCDFALRTLFLDTGFSKSQKISVSEIVGICLDQRRDL
ncbi:MAG: YolD-like family protein [Bacillota bacterium]|nr:YolD-like family protein [Bacillota bacterium]